MSTQSQQPDDATVGSQLLAALRQRTGVTELEYEEIPQRITGGMETLTYGFSLSAPPENLSGKLILRLFGKPGDVNQSRREAAFQNSLADLGYPVPRVKGSFESGIDDRPFNIMERIPGAPMMDQADLEPANVERIVGWFASIHARLHKAPSAPVIKAVAEAGFPQEQFSLDGRLKFMAHYFEGDMFSGLRPGFEWLVANKPEEQETPAVCHGDFHPGNIMVDGEKVTGVIDWPGAAFADPEFDVGTTLVLIRVGGAQLEPEMLPVFHQIADLYLHRYKQDSPLSMEKVNYYEALRSFRAFTRSTALLTHGVDPALVPRDHYPWSGDFAMQQMQSRLKQITGIDLPLPTST